MRKPTFFFFFKFNLSIYLGGPPIPPIAEKAGGEKTLQQKRKTFNHISEFALNSKFMLIFRSITLGKNSKYTGKSGYLPSFVATFFVSGWSVTT